ncbi:calcium/sodium antiporter [Altererythrobacter sp. MTPC7]|uniref:calcium/sodium antiporter n=1 Tax=Altererythrobacter sp. MTPC7 TaxID=3056567 RepID=UPI0036F401A4
MATSILLIVAGLIGLALGGELLVRGAVGIAKAMGLSNLLTGVIIVGMATSMPELVTSVEAARAGSPEIAWGNIVGSNISNTLLILGATALVAPIVLTGLGRRDAAVALGATAILVGLAFWQSGALWIGAALLALLVIYIVWRLNHPRIADDEEDLTIPKLPIAIVLFVAGLAALVFGGGWLVDGAIAVATVAGVSETVIGLTVVAIGTSLPELAASVAAAFRGKPGLAIGNVVGSNIYNILLIGGATMLMAPVALPREILGTQSAILLASAVALWALLWAGKTIGRVLGGVLLAAFTAYVIVTLL